MIREGREVSKKKYSRVKLVAIQHQCNTNYSFQIYTMSVLDQCSIAHDTNLLVVRT